jgi:hypothetical protein
MPANQDSASTDRVRGFYERTASRYNRQIRLAERMLFGDGRQWVCSQASGDVLELAIGTGRNLRYYRPDVRLTGTELSPAMLALARQDAAALGRDTDLREGDAQALEFTDQRFDTRAAVSALRARAPHPRSNRPPPSRGIQIEKSRGGNGGSSSASGSRPYATLSRRMATSAGPAAERAKSDPPRTTHGVFSVAQARGRQTRRLGGYAAALTDCGRWASSPNAEDKVLAEARRPGGELPPAP